MAFISEEISTEEDKKYFMTIGFTNMVNKPLKPDWWAIDRDRNIILTSRGGVIGEPWMGYQLYVENEFINMEVIKQRAGSRFSNDLKVKYIIEKIIVPQSLYQKGYSEQKIKQTIQEAFIGWGYPGVEESQLLGVTVEFKTELQCE